MIHFGAWVQPECSVHSPFTGLGAAITSLLLDRQILTLLGVFTATHFYFWNRF